MKRPNERGREDSENAIFDRRSILLSPHQVQQPEPYYCTLNSTKLPSNFPVPHKFTKLPTPWVTELWYLHKHTV